MPIRVTCSGCATKLNAPDTSAGKRIKCPKCQTVCPIPAPAFEVVDDPAPEVVPPPANDRPRTKRTAPADEGTAGGASGAKDAGQDGSPPKGKRATRDAREDDGDGPGARRRKGEPAAEKVRRSTALLVGAALAGLFVLLGGTALAVYWFGFRGKVAGPAPEVVSLDSTWEEYSSPVNVFRASFPGQPEAREWKPVGDMVVTSDIRVHRTGETALGRPSVSFYAGYVRFPDGVRPTAIADAKKWLTTQYAAPAEFGGGKSVSKVTAGGREWDEERMSVPRGGGRPGSAGVVRWHLAGPILHLVGYRAEYQTAPAEAVDKFFSSHQLLGGDPGHPDPDPVKPDGWQPYASPAGAFKASFPGETKEMSNFFFEGSKASEFRQYTLKDNKGRTRTYFAGYARFADKPTYAQARAVKEFARRESVGDTTTGRRRVAFGGWPWGEEFRLDADIGPSGIVRWVEAGAGVYVAGIRSPVLPGEKVVEQFFGAFEVLGDKPDGTEGRMPTGWDEYRAPGGEFRTAMPRNVGRSDDPFGTIGTTGRGQYAGVPVAALTGYRGRDDFGEAVIYVVRFRPNTAAADRQKVVDTLAQVEGKALNAPDAPEKKVDWAGRNGVERAFSPNTVARVAHDAETGVVAVATSSTPSPDVARVFLDNFSFDKNAPPLVPTKPGPPAGWAVFKGGAPDFRALMPGRVTSSDYKPSGRPDVFKPIAGGRRYTAAEGVKVYNIYMVIVVQFAPGTTAAERQAALNEITAPVILTPKAAKLESREKITWAGRDALEHVYTPADLCVCRQTHTETTGYVVAVVAQGTTLNAEKAKLFLDSFTFEK